MLDGAKLHIGLAEVGLSLLVDPARYSERRQHVERAQTAERRVAAAGDQLLGLDEKFDLTNAAPAELDVVAGDGDCLMTTKIMDLPLDRMDVGDGGVVEIFSPDV